MDTDDEIVGVDRESGRAYIPAASLGKVVGVLVEHDARITGHGDLIDEHAQRLARLEAVRPWWVRVWQRLVGAV